ncbi:SDR family oxidoreductase [Cupriavidus nantongensis]|uniref:3-ketoacyl-ACP reductase n=1 Tax=Cupriavidus nantongensis TaxID=1796606 RepID=A0A142JKW7_9BURK|nr:SDR family oxidoreductase [Cupriavidus nantongensis]AMR78729.1 3-ketoacyl-ACP reductase [Cupriavidus nantongensis]
MNTQTNLRPVAIVTGSSRGIGAAIAERLATDGHAVVINYAGRRDDAEALASRLTALGGEAIALQADVSDPHAVQRLFDATEARYGGVDVLVNNAGIMHLAPIAEVDDAVFDRLVAINLKGTFNGMREAARRLRDGGRIVNLSTSLVGTKLETYGVYAATKAAVETMTAILSKELRGRSITVNAVAPGPTATDLFLEGKAPELIDRMSRMNPLERLGTPADIAAVVSFLASSQGGWINGQVIRANGGMV